MQKVEAPAKVKRPMDETDGHSAGTVGGCSGTGGQVSSRQSQFETIREDAGGSRGGGEGSGG